MNWGEGRERERERGGGGKIKLHGLHSYTFTHKYFDQAVIVPFLLLLCGAPMFTCKDISLD